MNSFLIGFLIASIAGGCCCCRPVYNAYSPGWFDSLDPLGRGIAIGCFIIGGIGALLLLFVSLWLSLAWIAFVAFAGYIFYFIAVISWEFRMGLMFTIPVLVALGVVIKIMTPVPAAPVAPAPQAAQTIIAPPPVAKVVAVAPAPVQVAPVQVAPVKVAPVVPPRAPAPVKQTWVNPCPPPLGPLYGVPNTPTGYLCLPPAGVEWPAGMTPPPPYVNPNPKPG